MPTNKASLTINNLSPERLKDAIAEKLGLTSFPAKWDVSRPGLQLWFGHFMRFGFYVHIALIYGGNDDATYKIWLTTPDGDMWGESYTDCHALRTAAMRLWLGEYDNLLAAIAEHGDSWSVADE